MTTAIQPTAIQPTAIQPTAIQRASDSTEALDALPPLRPITIRPAPRREPPFDDELADNAAPSPARLVLLDGGRQPRLPFADGGTVRRNRPPIRLVPPPIVTPPAGRFGHSLVQGIVEVLNGLRPAAQLSAHLTPAIQAGLARDSTDLGRFQTPGRPPIVTSVHVCEPAEGIAELSAVISVDGRFRAIAARIEIAHGRWRCVRLQLG
ncbi:MAG: Rv3235 family protein [Jatrophihabitans sp.]